MNTNKYLQLSSPLKGFEEANTASQSQGLIQPGNYQLKEVRTNFPDSDTDYANIVVPAFGDEDTWICLRWKDKTYAVISERATVKADLINFDSDSEAIDEQILTDLLPKFYDFEYDFDQARYPFILKGFNAPLAPPATNNCCTFVEALVAKVWEVGRGIPWNMDNHKQMMIFSADDYFSPITCLVSQHIAKRVKDSDQSPHPWTVIQGWRKQWTSGHTFIIVDHHPETDRILTLESNSAYKMNGVGCRMIGNIRDIQRPPADWHKNPNLWTWERMKSVYQFRKQCVLKVKNTSWV